MCEILTLLIAAPIIAAWDVLKSATGIFLGTAAAWYFVVGPVLIKNERRKQDEALIESAIELINEVGDKIAEMTRELPPEKALVSEFNEKVNGLAIYVNRKIKSTIPSLCEAMRNDVNKLINGAQPPAGFVKGYATDDEAASLYVDRLITEVPEICQSLRRALDEYKQKAFLTFLEAQIPHYYGKLKSSPLWQKLVERLR